MKHPFIVSRGGGGAGFLFGTLTGGPSGSGCSTAGLRGAAGPSPFGHPQSGGRAGGSVGGPRWDQSRRGPVSRGMLSVPAEGVRQRLPCPSILLARGSDDGSCPAGGCRATDRGQAVRANETRRHLRSTRGAVLDSREGAAAPGRSGTTLRRHRRWQWRPLRTSRILTPAAL
jgi:hypothetical protein